MSKRVLLAKSDQREWRALPGAVRIVATYMYEQDGELIYRLVDHNGHAVTFKYYELTDEGKKLLNDTPPEGDG